MLLTTISFGDSMRETVLLIPEYAQELRGSLLHIAQGLMRATVSRDDIKLVVPYPIAGSRWKNWTPENVRNGKKH